MIIDGYKIALDEKKLDDMINNQMTDVVLIDENFEAYKNLSDGDKKALHHLVKASKIVNDIALEQDHPLNRQLKKGLQEASETSEHAKKALVIFNSINGVMGLNGIDEKPIKIFENIDEYAGRNYYPRDLSADEFHNILFKMIERGKIAELKNILSARSMVRRKDDELFAIDYTEYFAKEFSQIANELELAAHYSTNEEFNEFLSWQAQALLQNNEDMDMLADKHWAVMQDTPLEFTLSRENYDDQLTPTIFDNSELVKELENHGIYPTPKDMLGARAGIVNKQGTNLILEFKKQMSSLAKLMPFADKYEQKINSGDEVKQTMVDVDLASLQGDYAQCRGGMTIAQNLPNDDKLAIKTGGGRRNVYHRQVRMSGDKEREKKLLDALLVPKLHKYYDKEAEHIFTIGHENGHSLGPDSSYKTALGIYQHIIEEYKADVTSIAMMREYVKSGVISEDYLKKIYVTWVMRLLLKSKPQHIQPHRIGDLIHFNRLVNFGAIEFNSDKKISINFDKLHEVTYNGLENAVRIQLSKSPVEAKKFIDEFSMWDDLHKYIANTLLELGIKPYKNIRMFL